MAKKGTFEELFNLQKEWFIPLKWNKITNDIRSEVQPDDLIMETDQHTDAWLTTNYVTY